MNIIYDFISLGKIALFDKALVVALACAALAMCAMWVGNCLKKCAVEKNKKHRYGLSACLSGRQVGFLVLSIFRFYVLSQWFTFYFGTVVCLFTLGGNGRQLLTLGS